MGNLKSRPAPEEGSTPKREGHDGSSGNAVTPNPESLSVSSDFLALLDPRSPSQGVCRTPVEVRTTFRLDSICVLLDVFKNLIKFKVVAERENMRAERAKKLQALGLANTNESTSTSDSDPTSGEGSLHVKLSGTPESGDTLTLTVPQQAGNNTNLSKDLRKRLFISSLGDSLNTPEENKEN